MENGNQQLPAQLAGLTSPRDIINLDASRLEQLLRIAKGEAAAVQALVPAKEKAERKHAFLDKYRKGMTNAQGFRADTIEEKEWTAEFNAVVKSKITLNYIKQFDERVAPTVNNELTIATNNLNAALASSPALQLIPQDYRTLHAISTILSYLENGRASNWGECLDKFEQSGATAGGSGVRCPKCGSTNLQVTTQTDTEGGLDVGKAACGAFLLGPLGLLCGNKKKVVHHTDFWVCGSCGNKFQRTDK